MTTYQVNILNPKAEKLLKDLADLGLISLSSEEIPYEKLAAENETYANEPSIAYGQVSAQKQSNMRLTQATEDPFLALLNKIRKKAEDDAPTMEEITREVEIVRAERHKS